MYDECIATARSMVFARYAQYYTSFNSDLRELQYERFRNKGFGSWYVTKYKETCSTRLREVAEFVFGIYKQNLDGLGISRSTLNEDLKKEFSRQFELFFDFVSGDLKEKIKEKDIGKHFRIVDLGYIHSQIVSEYNSQIDLLSRKLTHEANRNHMTNKIAISGGNNTFQIGDHNTQLVQSTTRILEAEIDKSDSPQPQKDEAKTLLQKVLTNPILASIIGNVAGQIAKSNL